MMAEDPMAVFVDRDPEAINELWKITVPEHNYALEWDIVDNNDPEVISTHQRREFATRKEFDSYHNNIRAAEKERMCENVTVWVRRVQVFPWVQGLVV